MQREGKYITDFLSKVSFATFIIGSRRRIRRKKSYLLIGCVRESITLFYRMPQSNFNLLNVVINCKLEQKRGGKRTITSKLNGAEQIL
jgi:N-glycosylase/DNA lyase